MSANLLDTRPGSKLWNPRLAGGLALVLVFLCGAAAGAIVMDMGVHNRLRPPSFDTPAGKADYFQRLQKELDLSPAQAEQVQSVLNDFWQYYRTVLTDSKQRVEQLLNPEQQRKFEKFLQQQQPRWITRTLVDTRRTAR